MPAYNTEKYIAEAIESILNQSYINFEFLICDDGSTDSTLEVIKRYAEKDDRIRYFANKRNIGNLKTTNFLFKQCSGKYIAIQDSDDISKHSRLERLMDELESNEQLGVVGSNYVRIDSQNRPISSSFLPLTNDHIQSLLSKEVPPVLWGSCMFRKNILEKAGYFRIIFNRKGFADLDLLYRFCELMECKNLNSVLYQYRTSDQDKYPKKGILVQNGLDILVQSHLLRESGEKDFLDPSNHIEIRRFVSKLLFRRAEQSQWKNNFYEAQKLYMKSLIVYPFNFTAVKNIFKLMLLKNPNV